MERKVGKKKEVFDMYILEYNSYSNSMGVAETTTVK